jgi:hypothetical protein
MSCHPAAQLIAAAELPSCARKHRPAAAALPLLTLHHQCRRRADCHCCTAVALLPLLCLRCHRAAAANTVHFFTAMPPPVSCFLMPPLLLCCRCHCAAFFNTALMRLCYCRCPAALLPLLCCRCLSCSANAVAMLPLPPCAICSTVASTFNTLVV